MQFEFSSNSLDKISTDAVIIFAFQTEKQPQLFANFETLESKLQTSIIKAIETAKFTAKRGETLNFYLEGTSLAKSIILLGLGKEKDFIADDLRRAAGSFAVKNKGKASSIALQIPNSEITLEPKDAAQFIAEGLILGSYDFDKYKTKEKDKKELETIIISGATSAAVKEGIEKAKVYCEATTLARDLVNEQAAVATPTYLANLAQEIAKKDPKHIKCQVFNREQAKKLGMEAFLGIARAAETEPKFIVLEYTPDKSSSKEKLALVGKGITFDSGGINVKTGNGMIDMKCDMSGAAIVLSVFSVISRIKPQLKILGIVAATPNLISGKSLVPGDVVKAMNRKTIEVLDTDAEGRVTMADSLSYAVKENATKILDFATLTGACMIALGTDVTGLFSNNQNLLQEIKSAAFAAGEKMWELPLEKDYQELNKSEVADIANIPNTRYGGAITAALFLEEFVSNKPWAHMDIAGPAFLAKANDLGPKGGTGHGVRTVLNLLS
ncbi:MAG TPA: leucyl aminopeptidase [Patescibacteria group bacterium]|jgi:leucyl aminopeptidase|nr:leucyl aminopeptidase [Patescibacteria group bacterium]